MIGGGGSQPLLLAKFQPVFSFSYQCRLGYQPMSPGISTRCRCSLLTHFVNANHLLYATI